MLSNEIITICVKKNRNRYVIPVAFILWTRREWANGGERRLYAVSDKNGM